MASSSTYNTPCAACKFLRRKCMPGCIFSPYFPPEEPTKFANVHKIFGASNVTKLLNELLPHQREDAVNSLAYEAEARIRDPVYGCVGAISFLQRQVDRLQRELDVANADLIRCYARSSEINAVLSPPPPAIINPPPTVSAPVAVPRQRPIELSSSTTTTAGTFYQTPPPLPPPASFFQFSPYHFPWNDHNYTSSGNFNGGGGSSGGGKSI